MYILDAVPEGGEDGVGAGQGDQGGARHGSNNIYSIRISSGLLFFKPLNPYFKLF